MAAPNSQKSPFVSTISRFTHTKIKKAIDLAGKALPCKVIGFPTAGVPIVTVRFMLTGVFTLPDVTVPVAGAEYARMPTQIGDQGLCFPADVYLGGVSGLGGGTASLTQQGNLSTLVFFPIGNTAFRAVDPNVLVLYGPQGVTIEDAGQAMQLLLTPTQINLAGTGGPGVARIGDLVSGGVIVSGSSKVFAN